jgi:hypothetical protein
LKSFAKVAFVALIPAVTCAQVPTGRAATPLPSAVRQWVIDLGKICTDASGRPGKSPDIIKYADLTGDGIMDYIVEEGAFNCEGAATAMENGQSGSDVSVFVGGAGNTATRVYSGSVYATRIDKSGPRPRLYVGVSGQLCGQRNAANLSFAQQDFCLRPLNWVPARHTLVLAPVSEKRPFPQN